MRERELLTAGGVHCIAEGVSKFQRLADIVEDSERTGVLVENEAVRSIVREAPAPRGELIIRWSAYSYEPSLAYDPPWTRPADLKPRASACRRFASRGCRSATSDCSEKDDA